MQQRASVDPLVPECERRRNQFTGASYSGEASSAYEYRGLTSVCKNGQNNRWQQAKHALY